MLMVGTQGWSPLQWLELGKQPLGKYNETRFFNDQDILLFIISLNFDSISDVDSAPAAEGDNDSNEDENGGGDKDDENDDESNNEKESNNDKEENKSDNEQGKD